MTCFSSEMIIHISTTNQKFQMNVNQSKVPNECHVISTWFSTETQIFQKLLGIGQDNEILIQLSIVKRRSNLLIRIKFTN